jgi:hypothetical protein
LFFIIRVTYVINALLKNFAYIYISDSCIVMTTSVTTMNYNENEERRFLVYFMFLYLIMKCSVSYQPLSVRLTHKEVHKI